MPRREGRESLDETFDKRKMVEKRLPYALYVFLRSGLHFLLFSPFPSEAHIVRIHSQIRRKKCQKGRR